MNERINNKILFLFQIILEIIIMKNLINNKLNIIING